MGIEVAINNTGMTDVGSFVCYLKLPTVLNQPEAGLFIVGESQKWYLVLTRPSGS